MNSTAPLTRELGPGVAFSFHRLHHNVYQFQHSLANAIYRQNGANTAIRHGAKKATSRAKFRCHFVMLEVAVKDYDKAQIL